MFQIAFYAFTTNISRFFPIVYVRNSNNKNHYGCVRVYYTHINMHKTSSKVTVNRWGICDSLIKYKKCKIKKKQVDWKLNSISLTLSLSLSFSHSLTSSRQFWEQTINTRDIITDYWHADPWLNWMKTNFGNDVGNKCLFCVCMHPVCARLCFSTSK